MSTDETRRILDRIDSLGDKIGELTARLSVLEATLADRLDVADQTYAQTHRGCSIRFDTAERGAADLDVIVSDLASRMARVEHTDSDAAALAVRVRTLEDASLAKRARERGMVAAVGAIGGLGGTGIAAAVYQLLGGP